MTRTIGDVLLETIEDYDGCNYFLFAILDGAPHSNLIGTAYSSEIMNSLVVGTIEVFGGDDITYTLVEK